MRRFQNKHKGETCIIMGNGPGLKSVPKSFLEKYSTFGVNKIFKMKGFTPTYYVCVDETMLQHSCDKILSIKSKAIFVPYSFMMQGGNIVSFREVMRKGFSKDACRYLWGGWTVVFVCLQLAYWMGFQTVLLVGVDHYYEFPEGTFTKKFQIKRLVSDGNDINHFTPDYHEPGEEYMAAPDLRRMEESYTMAEQAFRDDRRRIVNLTPESALYVFELGDIKEWM